MGAAAGRAMAGDPTPYTHLPFFYSDLFDMGYEAVGTLDARLERVADWKEPFREGVVYYLEGGRVRGVLPPCGSGLSCDLPRPPERAEERSVEEHHGPEGEVAGEGADA